MISSEARAEFNRCLKAEGKPAGRLGRRRDCGAALVGQGAAGAALGSRAYRCEAGGDCGRNPQLARSKARGALVALHHDGRGDGLGASARARLARCSPAGAMLWHTRRHIPSWHRRRARNAGAEGQRGVRWAQAQVHQNPNRKIRTIQAFCSPRPSGQTLTALGSYGKGQSFNHVRNASASSRSFPISAIKELTGTLLVESDKPRENIFVD
jgi:hypothetical protein